MPPRWKFSMPAAVTLSAEPWRTKTQRALGALVIAGNESVKGGQKLLAEDVGFLQQFVAGTGDGQDLAAAQAACIVRDRARRNHLVVAGADEHHRDVDPGDEFRVLYD